MARHLARILTALSGTPWAITASGLDELVALAAREPVTIEALARKAERRSSDDDGPVGPAQRAALAAGREYLRDAGSADVLRGVAVIRIFGPLIAYASWLEDLCGITSYESIKADLKAAVAHRAVNAVLFEIDSPGGQVTGCSGAALAIRQMREVMPTVAYVAGDACSAALWLASGAEHIAISKTAGVGSLGCVYSIIDRRAADEKAGIENWEMVSTQTPGKRPDPATEAGRAAIQQNADDTADVFLDEVAANRGLSREVVRSAQFGQGAVLIGQKAVDAGLADEVSTWDEVFEELADAA